MTKMEEYDRCLYCNKFHQEWNEKICKKCRTKNTQMKNSNKLDLQLCHYILGNGFCNVEKSDNDPYCSKHMMKVKEN